MFVLSVLEAPNTKTNSLCVQTHLAIKLFLILNCEFISCNSDFISRNFLYPTILTLYLTILTLKLTIASLYHAIMRKKVRIVR